MAKIPVTQESFERFCALVEQGMPRFEAAQEIGTTATRVRWAAKRNPAWQRRYNQAMSVRRRTAELRRLTGMM